MDLFATIARSTDQIYHIIKFFSYLITPQIDEAQFLPLMEQHNATITDKICFIFAIMESKATVSFSCAEAWVRSCNY